VPLSASEFVRQAKAEQRAQEKLRGPDYRRASLAIHPWVCAKCGKEFTKENLDGLTVHHRDHNHANNPPDGSNWEHLCIECHADEHSRMELANAYAQATREASESEPRPADAPAKSTGLGTLADKFGALLKNPPR
jgi:5-methylcytosine-specific restriction endonuclease McrA